MQSVNPNQCMGRNIWRTSLLVAIFGMCALYANFFTTVRMTVKTEYEPASLERLMAGTSPAPFQYRMLVPWVIGTVQEQHGFPALMATAKGYARLVETVFTFGLFVVMWGYLGLFFESRAVKAVGLLLLVHMLNMTYLTPKIFSFYYVYDIPSVFFFTLGLVLIFKKRMMLFYALFIVATINRETSCFMTVIYLLVNWRGNMRQALLHCGVQAAIWFAIKAMMMSLYPATLERGTLMIILSNWHGLMDPISLFQVVSSLGFLWIFPLLGWRWLEEPFLRKACLVVPLFAGALFFVGNVQEIRIYGEMIPVVLPAALLIMGRMFVQNEAIEPMATPR